MPRRQARALPLPRPRRTDEHLERLDAQVGVHGRRRARRRHGLGRADVDRAEEELAVEVCEGEGRRERGVRGAARCSSRSLHSLEISMRSCVGRRGGRLERHPPAPPPRPPPAHPVRDGHAAALAAREAHHREVLEQLAAQRPRADEERAQARDLRLRGGEVSGRERGRGGAHYAAASPAASGRRWTRRCRSGCPTARTPRPAAARAAGRRRRPGRATGAAGRTCP